MNQNPTNAGKRPKYAKSRQAHAKKVRKSTATKLIVKSEEQKKLMDDYFKSNQLWNKSQIQQLGLSTGLSSDKVYKYLWNKKRKNLNTNKIKQFNQNCVQYKKLKKKNKSEIEECENSLVVLDKVTLNYPSSLHFVSSFYIFENQQIDQKYLDLLRNEGFKLFCHFV